MSVPSSVFHTEPPGSRRLVAVVHMDVVGYSRLLSQDDVETVRRLGRLRHELIDPAIEAHSGCIVQTGGDSLLVVFDSIEGAVRCSVHIQQRMADHDAGEPPDQRTRLRIGINMGDAIPQATDLHGEAVVIAVRLETACPPGGVCVSRAVYENVQSRLGLAFEKLGALELKNIARPVEAFVLRLDAPVLGAPVLGAPVLGAPVLGAPVLGAPVNVPAPAPEKGDERPAIAVLPLRVYNAEDEPFADGLAEELIDALSAWRSFPVIARNSVFAWRGREVDVRTLGRDLGVRYIASGSVRRRDHQLRVRVELADVQTGETLMSERFEQEGTDPLALQDGIARAIAGVLGPEVQQLERARAFRRATARPSAYDLFVRGMWHRYRNTKEDLEQAMTLFRAALEIDPHYAAALAALSLSLNYAATSRWVPDPQAAYAESLKIARQAVEEDPRDPHAHFAFGVACMNQRRLADAIAELREAIRLNPSHAFAHANLGQVFNYLNQPAEGLVAVERGLTLNPHDPRRFMWLPYLAASHYLLRHYKASLAAAEQALQANPKFPLALRYAVAALGQLGRSEEAQALFPLIRRVDNDYAGLEAVLRRTFVTEAAEHLLDGIRRAGFA